MMDLIQFFNNIAAMDIDYYLFNELEISNIYNIDMSTIKILRFKDWLFNDGDKRRGYFYA